VLVWSPFLKLMARITTKQEGKIFDVRKPFGGIMKTSLKTMLACFEKF